MKIIFLLILFTISIDILSSNTISGYILEYGNREPIAFATIKIIDSKNIKEEKYSNEDGKFIFENLKFKNYTLIIDDINDFKGKEFKISFDKDSKIKKTFFLKKISNSNYMLNVKKKKDKENINKQQLSKKDFDKIAGTNNNFIEVIKKLPGVSRNSGLDSSGLIIRGTGSLNSRVFIAGHFTPILYHFSGITPIFNSELIKSIDFYPGNFSVKYGKASGGVVDIKIRDANTLKESKKTHGYLDFNIVDTSMLFEYPINKKSGIALTFKKSFIDITYPIMIQTNDISRRLPIYYDWQLRYNYAFSKKNKVSFTHFGSNDEYKFVNSDSSKILNYDDYSAKSFLVVNIFDWYYKISKGIKSNFSASFQYNNRSFKLGEFIKIKNIPYLGIIKEDLTFKLSKYFKLNTGIENWAGLIYTYAEVPSSALKNYTNKSLGDYRSTNYFMEKKYYQSALYSELLFNLNSLYINLGLRGEYSSLNNSFSIDPRFNTFYKFSKNFLVKAGVGIFHQTPFEYQTDKNFGNPNLKNQYAIQYIFGIKLDYKLFTSSIDIFYNSQKDLIVIDSENNYNNNGEGKAYGLEYLFKYSLKNSLKGWISYTLMKSLYRDNPSSDWSKFDYDQTHIINIVSSYKMPWNINISLALTYNTGSPYTPIITSILDSDKNTYIPIYGEKNSERLRDFFKLNFRIDKEFIFKYWKYTIYLDIQNITNQINEEGKAYNHNYTDYVLIQGVPFFPSIGFKGKF